MGNCEQCIVRQFSSLKALDKSELLRLADCKTSYTIKKGQSIFEEGDLTNGIYCIKQGVCKLSKLSPAGKDQIIKFIRPGELLGQRSMISEQPTNLSAVAVEDMEVCFIPKAEILGFFTQNNKFSLNVMKDICADLKDADDLSIAMAQKSVKERLAGALLYLEEVFDCDFDETLRVQLSREELAGMIGTATESCIRLLSEFKKKGLIDIKGKKIALLNRKELQKIANQN